MMCILDTDVLSELSRDSAHGALKAWIRLQPARSLIVTFSTYFEIYRGIERLRTSNPCKSEMLERWFIRLMEDERFMTVAMTPNISKLYAQMTLTPELKFLWITPARSKEPKCGQDLAIASVAITQNLPIVTRNTKDFLTIHRYFPLPGLYDPVRQIWHVDVDIKPNVDDSIAVELPQLFP